MKAFLAAMLAFVSVSISAHSQEKTLGIFDSQSEVGANPKQGTAAYDAATAEYRITGGGANIWADQDAFYFIWRRLTGDATFTADVHFLGKGAVDHRKAVLMVRQSLDADSAYADGALHGDGLTSLQFRTSAGAATQEIRSSVSGPLHFRLQRRGNQFTLFAGSANDDQTPSGPVTVVLRDPVYIGLGVCSHDESILETAVFSKVKIE